MNFPTVNQDPCPDAALSDTQTLILKPSQVTTCVAGEMAAFKTFLASDSAGEVEVTTGLTYTSSNPGVIAVNSTTGAVTLVGAGIATVSVTNGSQTATAQVEVIGSGECCDDVAVATCILVDNSLSMSANMPAYAGTRLEWAKQMVYALVSEIRIDKDSVGLQRFNIAAYEVQAIAQTVPSLPTISGIPQTDLNTDIKAALTAGIAALAAATADRRVLVMFSDGENRGEPLSPIPDPAETIALAANFKAGGGIIIAVGAAASGVGFALLQSIASPGFFLNASDETATDAVAESLIGMLCYYCGGLPPAYGNCLAAPIPPQVPVESALTSLEY